MHPPPHQAPVLLCTIGARQFALPLTNIIECLRPLPTEAVSAMPWFVLGVAMIRGAPVPVVDVGALVGIPRSGPATRFVVLRLGDRRVALAVEGVTGTRQVDGGTFPNLPPLLAGAASDTLAAVGVLDEQLLLLLQPARAIPDDVWQTPESPGGRT